LSGVATPRNVIREKIVTVTEIATRIVTKIVTGNATVTEIENAIGTNIGGEATLQIGTGVSFLLFCDFYSHSDLFTENQIV
jgi:hypothetical protein